MSVITFLFGAGALQGLLLSCGLLLRAAKSKDRVVYFPIGVLALSGALFMKWLYSPELFAIWPQVWYLSDFFSLSIGSLWYFSVLKAIGMKDPKPKRTWWTLTMALPFVAFLVYIFTLPKSALSDSNPPQWLESAFYMFCVSAITINSLFVRYTRIILNEYKHIKKLGNLKIFQKSFEAILCIWILSFAIGLLLNTMGFVQLITLYHSALLGFVAVLFLFAILAISNPKRYDFLFQKATLTDIEISTGLLTQLDELVKSERLYSNPRLTLDILANRLQRPPKSISKAIQVSSGKSLKDYLNDFRLDDFVNFVKSGENDHLTYEAIGEMAGFGSKMTLYNNFKKRFGKTPKAYFEEAERPGISKES